MERQKAFLGWKCGLSPEEVQFAKEELVLSEYIEKWKSLPDGTATLRIAPWRLGSKYTMELFSDCLTGYMFPIRDVEQVGEIEIVEREY